MSDLSAGYVLICHAPEDRDYAEVLARQLKGRRIRARYDQRGAAIEQLIKLARRADALLVVMTPAAHDSEALSAQIEAARDLQVPTYALAVDNNEPMVELGDEVPWRVTRNHPLEDTLVTALARDVEAPPPPSPRRLGLPIVAVLVAMAVALTVAVTAAVAHRGDPGPEASPTTKAGPATTGSAPGTTGSAPPAGTVTIASPADGAVVKKCEHVSGSASLPENQTILYAVDRVSPPDKTWYYGYLGSYENGSVPSTMSGDVYFGSATAQKYDLFLYVMSVGAARTFWNAHKSSDGSYAFAAGPPAGVKPAAHVRVTQGSVGDC